ncbi:hypothetical protein BH20VER1_BH20VER1_19660 [soil metagenome]
MDNKEAKFVLAAYRPGGADASDPQFREALAQMREDPGLTEWFRESVAFDTAVAERLRGASVPAELRETIVVGAKFSSRSPSFSRMRTWAVAAVLLLAAVGAFLFVQNFTRAPSLAGWQTAALEQVTALVKHETKFDAQAGRSAELAGALPPPHAPIALQPPPQLRGLASIGCKTFSWDGRAVSIICFVRADGGLVHLIVIHAPGADDPAGELQLRQHEEWATATWREGDQLLMIALQGGRDDVRQFL